MQLPVLDRLILSAQKPSRYAGGELNAVRKDLRAARVTWALAFPDTYEVGMTNVGFFDAFVIGEGEEVVHEISDAVASWKRTQSPREDLLWLLAEIPGVYVPSLFRPRYNSDGTIGAYEPLKPGYESIVRRVIPD